MIPGPPEAGGPSAPLSKLLEHCADAVQAVLRGRSLTDALAACPAALRPGTQALSFAVLRRLGGAQVARDAMVERAPPPNVDALLLCAIALLWPDPAPPYADHTLVDQAVTAARHRVPAASGFLNAVLRRFIRERAQIVAQAAHRPEGAWNHPAWWIERVRRDWPAQWQPVLEAAQSRPPMTLRVNRRQLTGAAYLDQLAAAGLPARLLGPQCVQLGQAVPVERLPGFAQGQVSVQDAAAQRAAPLLVETAGLAPGARVLDACAAPGGKTAHLLELADLDVLALDSDAGRLARVRETLARLRLQAEVRAADARQTATWWDGRPFDAVLLDAPCSGSGIVRRHPDIRWLRRPADIDALTRMQAELLEALWPLVKPGGWLLYATCSIFRAEGEHRIDAFMQRHGASGAAYDPRSPGHLLPLPENERSPGATPAGRAADEVADGFYYALLRKEPDAPETTT